LPGFRPPPRRGLRCGGFFPGRSSALGGIDEFPLLREISRSSRSADSPQPRVPRAQLKPRHRGTPRTGNRGRIPGVASGYLAAARG